jgi:hypothetical protein
VYTAPKLNNNQPVFDMNALMEQIMTTPPVTTTRNRSTTTTINKQNESPELVNLMNQYTNQLNTLGQNTQLAYQNKQNTYADLIASLTNMYGAMGGGQSGAASTSALASGLTPLEAQQAGNTVLQQVMQQYFPALAGVTNEQSQVGVDLQTQLQQQMQALGLPFLQNVQSPYYTGVAGKTDTVNSTGTTTTSDPYKQLSLLANLSTAQSADTLGWAQLQEKAREFGQNLDVNQSQFAQGQQNDLYKAMQQLGMKQYEIGAQSDLERNKMAQEVQLREYLQQLAGGQAMDRLIKEYGLREQSAVSEYNRSQDTGWGKAVSDFDSWIDSL